MQGDQVLAALFFLFVLFVYSLPFITASARYHRNTGPILLTNLFFGWSILGWLVALIWSFSDNVRPSNKKGIGR